jgi:hypothetical protein
LEGANGLFVEVRIDLIAGVTILRMAVSSAHKDSQKIHELQRLVRKGWLVRSIACSSPSSAVIKRGHFRDSADFARRVTPEYFASRVSSHSSSNMVDCPICAKAVKDARINEHIDSACTDFLLEAEPQGTPNLGKAYSFFTPGARKLPGATQKNGHPTSSPPAPPTATQLVERSKTPPAATKRTFDEAADAPTNGEPHSPSAPKRARKLKAVTDAMPLAERMRPMSLDDVYGQELVGPGGVLRGMVDEGRLPSMVLWGRPGTGNDPPMYPPLST